MTDGPGLVRVVFVDSNVLYSRVLRDFLLYAADEEIITVAWSAAEATVLCTANTKDFPTEVVAVLGLEVMTPDVLLSALATEFPSQMLTVHATSVERLRGATDESTIAALHRAGAPTAARLVARLLHTGE